MNNGILSKEDILCMQYAIRRDEVITDYES